MMYVCLCMLINAHYDSVSVVSTLTCRFTFICRFFGPLKGLPFNTLENYGMASWWPVKFRSNAVFQGLILCVFCLKCMIVYHADAKSTLKSSIFAWKLLGQRGPGALRDGVMMTGQIEVERCFSRFDSVRFLFKMHDCVPCRCKINLEK